MDFLHDTFAIEIVDYDKWHERSRTNNFFELVYVLSGTGKQSINYVLHDFEEHAIHLVSATKCYRYIIESPARFLIVRFTGSYFVPLTQEAVDYSSWFSRLNFILANHKPGELVPDPEDKVQVKRLLDAVLYEYERKDPGSAFIIQSTLVAVLAIVSRNIQKEILKHRDFTDTRFADVLNFISFNILDKNKITVRYLADKFHISETYFSEYFKRNASESFQDFVLKSRLKIAESRARYTDATLQVIAWELGFTDSSHLNRMMKKHFGRGMREMRKEAV
ncbi:helix-turn-helix domain-containing protein [Flavobacterium kingsejongi]|uniref:HTH araC/xylS-type domain-containing protein n=1 Tax=Flavobacterium kingsejongi TaxID=1678728 RepID=A0A2S1LPJ2_9FLAO|nr:AraC family transcriptional regulator [Flavobacterium kingsejongi]AWG25582.1 hypothetical protein FK004_10240 [Flavobacterium kingsejongi]